MTQVLQVTTDRLDMTKTLSALSIYALLGFETVELVHDFVIDELRTASLHGEIFMCDWRSRASTTRLDNPETFSKLDTTILLHLFEFMRSS